MRNHNVTKSIPKDKISEMERGIFKELMALTYTFRQRNNTADSYSWDLKE